MKFIPIFLAAVLLGACSINIPLRDCQPDNSLIWVQGPSIPSADEQARTILQENGIKATVRARNYGQMDSCGVFTAIGLDLIVSLQDAESSSELKAGEVHKGIFQLLDANLDPPLRSIWFNFQKGEGFFVNEVAEDRPDPEILALPIWSVLSAEPINRNVYILAYDPILQNGQKLTEFEGWQAYLKLANDYVDFFKELSDNRIQYNIVYSTEVNDVWLEKTDGFTYTEEAYLDVIDRGMPRHDPDIADYGQFMNNAEYDICGKLNRGEIDELWLFGGPWFGFNESRLAGPQGFNYNSTPFSGTTCNKLIPIMGFNYERSLTQMLESFGHRVEATMEKVYENRRQNYIWGLFGLSALRAPNAEFSGCGIVHFPPNAEREYDYSSQSTVESICDDFLNYPSLSAPSLSRQPTSCMSWGCSTFGFFTYWYRHIPANTGVAPDGTSNDWWQYIIDPNLIQAPFSHLVADLPIDSPAEFSFRFNGDTSGFYVDVSTTADFSAGVLERFAEGVISPLINQEPSKWDQFGEGETLYWKVTSNSGIQSPVQRLVIAEGT